MMFTLHPTLAADTTEIVDGPLSRVLLLNDSTYPWLVLVPKQDGLVELTDLSPADQVMLMREITAVAAVMKTTTRADKMNVATLGNMVPQLHIHLIARFVTDPAWPRPVWGAVPTAPYAPEVLTQTARQWQARLDAPLRAVQEML